jgi:predicted transcriptional regulator
MSSQDHCVWTRGVFLSAIKKKDLKNAQLLLTFSRGAKSRRNILQELLLRPKNCNQIANGTKLDWWTVQKHLQHLISYNLVECLNFGQIKFYSITVKGKETLISCSQNVDVEGGR